MKQRFITVPMCFAEEGAIYTSDLRINPFNIEAYVSTKIEYTDDMGMMHEETCTRIYTKGGLDFDLLMTVEEFEETTKHF